MHHTQRDRDDLSLNYSLADIRRMPLDEQFVEAENGDEPCSPSEFEFGESQ